MTTSRRDKPAVKDREVPRMLLVPLEWTDNMIETDNLVVISQTFWR